MLLASLVLGYELQHNPNRKNTPMKTTMPAIRIAIHCLLVRKKGLSPSALVSNLIEGSQRAV